TTSNTNMILGKTLLTRLFRDLIFVRAMRQPVVQRKIAARSSQLNVNYRGGPLARMSRLQMKLAPGVRAGDRAPNATCLLRSTGAMTTLGVQTCTGWALLVFGAAAAELDACAATLQARLGSDARVVPILRRGESAAG